ncbi:MAG: methyltransferase domain-containing protein [Tabrizicola sp.]|jgi:SAM-dependent methyltransferase|nr:methyltransferase domain-containing protein [Tabrizicola sp.]
MATEPLSSGTARANGAWWGASARDWAMIQEGQFRPGYEAVLAHCEVGPGTAYMDSGCGAGMAAEIAAARGALVSGFDAAEALLDIARERVPGGDFRLADMEAVPFADGSFDLVTGFNAFQFAGDQVRALSEARRVARPGGRVVVMTWGDPEGMEAAAIVGALRPLLPAQPPGAAGPFALSDKDKLRGLAVAAGLVPEDVVDVDSGWRYPDEATAVRGLGSSGVAARAKGLVGSDAVDEAHRAALVPFRQPDGSFRIGASCRFLVART